MKPAAASLFLAVTGFLACASEAAAPGGLQAAQDLYRENHWAEARELLKSSWTQLNEAERTAGTFLIGRSWVREAEFYDGVHRFTVSAGSEYLAELKSASTNRRSAWIPLFTGFYHLDAGRRAEAERSLNAAFQSPTLPADWKALARARLKGAEEPASSPPGRLAAAAALCRTGATGVPGAEALTAGIDLDKPDVEEEPEKGKVLRFFDPQRSRAWARLAWERAAAELKPLAERGHGPEATLAAFYRGLSLDAVGASDLAAAQMKAASDTAVLSSLLPIQKVVTARASWDARPAAPALAALWDETRGHREGVFYWADLVADGPARPIADRVGAALRDAVSGLEPRGNGADYGRWGLARLSLGAEAREVLEVLEAAREKSNKNKLESNDPLLLLAICRARVEIQDYPQALETLFEMSKTLPGLRPLQWNLQGLYAARQKAGGEARISQ